MLHKRRAAGCVLSPPLRKQNDIDALWEALAKDTLSTTASDNCTFCMEQKKAGKVWGGMQKAVCTQSCGKLGELIVIYNKLLFFLMIYYSTTAWLTYYIVNSFNTYTVFLK